MGRARLRDLGLTIGRMPPGPLNAITDVPGVLVGHRTVIRDTPRVTRTGVTMVVPREGSIWTDYAFAGYHSFNGNGEMTGIPWIEESGLLGSPIGITNTYAVGIVRDALVGYAVEHGYSHRFHLPVVAETFDGYLNDIDAFPLTREDAFAALTAARGGPGWKGGIGTSSRHVEVPGGAYTVGALVQANYGRRHHLRVDGVPVGRELEAGADAVEPRGSIIVIIATDAPLLAVQCRRLAQRATAGLARAGGLGFNSSGDLFLAFATGNHVREPAEGPYTLQMLPHAHLDPFFEGTAEAVEEAILNALCAAETMRGYQGTVEAIPLEALVEIVGRHRPPAGP